MKEMLLSVLEVLLMSSKEKEVACAFGSHGSQIFEGLLLGVILNKDVAGIGNGSERESGSGNTGFLHSLKVELAYGTFQKPKWHKAKKQGPQDTPCSGMHTRNRSKAQTFTDTVQGYGGWMLGYRGAECVPGESARRRPLAAGEHAASLRTPNAIFAFRPFSSKMKILLELL